MIERLKDFGSHGVFVAEYIGYKFSVPIYPWQALLPYWPSVTLALSKILVYHDFNVHATQDHHAWRANKQGLDALRFLDLLSRDRGFALAVKSFNEQYEGLRYGPWMASVHSLTSDWKDQITQLGQFVHNVRSFLSNTGYLEQHSYTLGLNLLRPYWIPPRTSTLKRKWFGETFGFMDRYYKQHKRYPSVKSICDHWGISRSTLTESNLIRPILIQLWRRYRETGKVEPLKEIMEPIPTHRLVTEEDQKEILKRTFGKTQE